MIYDAGRHVYAAAYSIIRRLDRKTGASPFIHKCCVASVHVLRFQMSRTALELMQNFAATAFAFPAMKESAQHTEDFPNW
mmetsp:Transcript_20241/g.56078  ORF Transcript_20241/g.56078 Transcript_20241/m.56078 type:complete len:80 (+) Transcript_20241:212-451(+)